MNALFNALYFRNERAEQLLSLGYKFVETFTAMTATSSGVCEQLAITWLCHVAFRPCSDLDLDPDTVRPRPSCRHQCELLQGRRQCSRVFQLVKRHLLTG